MQASQPVAQRTSLSGQPIVTPMGIVPKAQPPGCRLVFAGGSRRAELRIPGLQRRLPAASSASSIPRLEMSDGHAIP
jgi:hypothetical protein